MHGIALKRPSGKKLTGEIVGDRVGLSVGIRIEGLRVGYVP